MDFGTAVKYLSGVIIYARVIVIANS
jgi:hypothetical protein